MGRKDGGNSFNNLIGMAFWGNLFGVEEKKKKVEELKQACDAYKYNQENLVKNAKSLYKKRKRYLTLFRGISKKLERITNLPEWCKEDFDDSMKRVEAFQTAVEYEKDPKKFAEQTDKTGRTAAYVGAGTVAGTAIATMGSTAAMSIATVLGTASTGTAISALSGVAATNAALAWLGGGAVAAGGAGMAGGSLVLAMFGPIGWTIAGVSAISGFAWLRASNKKQAEEAGRYLSEIKRDNNTMAEKLSHLMGIIRRSDNHEKNKLGPSIEWLDNVSPKDYKKWDDNQKHELEKLLNAVSNTVSLINERI